MGSAGQRAAGGRTPAPQVYLTHGADEKFLPPPLHVVERPHLRHAAVDLANGEHVGEDEFGNAYFRTRGGKIDPTLGFERRWVIYNGYAEADRAAVVAWLAASHRRRAAD